MARSRAGVDLALEVIQVELGARRLRMHFGIGRDRDLEVGDALQRRDEIGGIGKTVRLRLIRPAALRRIAAQRDDMANAVGPIGARDLDEFLARRADAGEMRRAGERRLALDAVHDMVRALASRAVRAVGDRDEAGSSGASRCTEAHSVSAIWASLGGKNSNDTSTGRLSRAADS